jgi:uncharacterized RDD family membrane protein YckC
VLLESEPSISEAPETCTEDHTEDLFGPAAQDDSHDASRSWQEELSKRIAHFRHHRVRRRKIDPGKILGLNFEQGGDQVTPNEANENEKVLDLPKAPRGTDAELQSMPPPTEVASGEEAYDAIGIIGPNAAETNDLTLGDNKPKQSPLEIVFESPKSSLHPQTKGEMALALPVAPLSKRFLAGLADAIVLLLGACVYALIFWRTGGHLTPGPLAISILVFIAVSIEFGYFSLLTALASTTPGLLWMGIEIRNLNGTRPTFRESFWRGFGYLVSSSALMLGFLWSIFDADNLTWHDRMSGTFLTPISQENTVESTSRA